MPISLKLGAARNPQSLAFQKTVFSSGIFKDNLFPQATGMLFPILSLFQLKVQWIVLLLSIILEEGMGPRSQVTVSYFRLDAYPGSE